MARAAKKRNVKTKFKWNRYLTILISFLALIGLLTGLLSIETKSEKLYKGIISAQQKLASDSDALNEKNVFSWISHSDLKKKIKSNSYTYVYYGSTGVVDFLANIEEVNQQAKDADVKKVYLYSSKWAENLDLKDEEDGEKNKEKLLNKEESLCGVELTTYPQVWIFKNGELVFNSYEITHATGSNGSLRLAIMQAFTYEASLENNQ